LEARILFNQHFAAQTEGVDEQRGGRGGGEGRRGRIGEARGYSYTSGPIKYNSSVQHWLISQRGGNSFRVFKSSLPTLFSKEKHPIARISRGGARSNILLPPEEI